MTAKPQIVTKQLEGHSMENQRTENELNTRKKTEQITNCFFHNPNVQVQLL